MYLFIPTNNSTMLAIVILLSTKVVPQLDPGQRDLIVPLTVEQ